MRTTRWVAAGLLGLVAVVGMGASPASAHSKLESSSPADGAVLATPPTTVSFTFDEPLLPGTDTISVSDPDGNVIASEQVAPDGSTISLPWPADATSGTFQAAYRVVSGDGHPVTGAITVTIEGSQAAAGTEAAVSSDPMPTSSPTAAPAEPARGVAAGLVVLIALAVLVLGAVAGVVLWRRRPR